MPYDGEFASYKPLRRLVESKRIQSVRKRIKVKKTSEEQDENNYIKLFISQKDLPRSSYEPDFVIAIDGSRFPYPAENGFPGAEYGYITIASVIIRLQMVRKLDKQEFIDPKEFRQTEKSSSVDCVLPGTNVIVDHEKTPKASFRKMLFEELQQNRVFSDCESLLETYEALLKIKLENDKSRPAKSPIDGVEENMTYDYGVYKCPYSGEELYSTDATRLHELMKEGGSNVELYTQVMQMFEKLWLIHILRSFEKKEWLHLLKKVAFILDGPLACFSTWSWLNKSIVQEIARINSLQKKINGTDLLIIGIEKTGTFMTHFIELDTEKNGTKDKIPSGSALLLTDQYIKQNIVLSDSDKQYGADTYFGRKFFYKATNGNLLVPVIAFFDKRQADLRTSETKQYPRLNDVLYILDKLVSSRYSNSISPLISAHAEAAIPLNLGKRIFEDMAKDFKKST